MTTKQQAMQAVIDGQYRFRGYPAHYAVRVTGGWSLVAVDGPHKGGVFGCLWIGGLLSLDGRDNFRNRDRLVGRPRPPGYAMRFSGGRWRGVVAANTYERIGRCGARTTWRAKP